MVTLLWKGNEFKISHQEMIKGMRRKGTGKTWSYGDELIIPIIENTPDEEDLREGMEEVRLLFSPPPANGDVMGPLFYWWCRLHSANFN